ncbi:MAG: DUF4271 domain-containing protein [Bacteroidetes bacterium]|nr:DUF4271 domain-containing protein [Bacteroidota bacterium]
MHRHLLLQLNELSGGNFSPEVIAHGDHNWWIALLLFSCFTMIVVLRVFDSRRLISVLSGFIRPSSVMVVYRDEVSFGSRVTLLLLLNYLLVMGLFAWKSAGLAGINADGIKSIGWIILALTSAYVVKIYFIRLFGKIFDLKEAAKEYEANVLLFNEVIGLVLFPLVLLIAYARQIPQEWLVWCGITAIISVLIYRFLRLILIGIANSSVSFLYLILYLCTLELLPFVVLIKVFVVKFHPFHP